MALLPALLVLASCFTHAGWNLLARHSRDELTFFARMLAGVVPVAAVAMAVAWQFPHAIPPRAWAYGAASGLVGGFYMWFLALAYRSGDFTVVYPVARALPVLAVAVIDVLRGHFPTPVGWLAMGVIMLGCVVAPQTSYRDFGWRHYRSRTILWVVATAGMVVAFSMLDKLAAEAVSAGLPSAMVYCALWHMGNAVAYLPLCRFTRRSAEHVASSVGWRTPIAASFLGFFTYSLVLWAFQMSPHTGYLLAFRQFSIVIGVAVAFRAYREPGLSVRIPATLAIVVGLVLLVVFG